NATSTKKTIDNWRTEISALFAFIQETDNEFFASLTARRLSTNQYLDEFFNYFLYTFQYPAGHVKPHTVIDHIRHGVKFKPCDFVLKILIEGTALLGKPFRGQHRIRTILYAKEFCRVFCYYKSA
ncbi:MAG: hypothetical protein ACRC9I_12120, partial [Acinetobacter sp.]